MSRLGIDMGSTNSCCATWDGRAARMVELAEGVNTIMPSVVTVADGAVYVGEEAIEIGKRFPEFCFRHFKRRLAEPWNDNEDTGHQTCRGPDGMLHFRGPNDTTYSPTELVSFILGALVDAADARMQPHDHVTGAVICVPADFTRSQRDAMIEAAKAAGIEEVELMHEPTAAALAYGFDVKKARRIAVFDAGGGAIDATGVQTGAGLVDVLSTNGIRDLGGEDFDRRVADYVINLWRTEHGSDLKVRDAAMVRIMTEAEAAKKRLSDKQETIFRIDDIDRTKEGIALHMIYPINRATFDELTRDLCERIQGSCRSLMNDLKRQDANFSAKDFHDVLLVGGMTRVPAIRQLVKEFFGKDPKRENSPEQVVAMGAAIRAAVLDGRKTGLSIADITSHALAIETTNGMAAVLVPRGTSYPMADSFTLSNPDAEQSEISVRLMAGDGARASTCELLWSADIPIEPGEEQSARVGLKVKIDASGRASVEVGDQRYEAAA